MKLHLKIKCKKLRKSRLKFMQIRTILYQYIKTLIKHVFLLNFTYELLMSFRIKIRTSLRQIDSYLEKYKFARSFEGLGRKTNFLKFTKAIKHLTNFDPPTLNYFKHQNFVREPF